MVEKVKIKLSELSDMYDIEDDHVAEVPEKVKQVVNADVEFDEFTETVDEEEIKDG